MAGIGAKAPSEKKRRSIGSPLDPAESRAAQNDGPGSAAIVYPLGWSQDSAEPRAGVPAALAGTKPRVVLRPL